jgi:hypothetical protein
MTVLDPKQFPAVVAARKVVQKQIERYNELMGIEMEALRHVSSQMILSGAYGRNYETKKAAVRDWEAGRDFKIVDGPYCSVRDLDQLVEESSGVYIVTKQGYVRVA